MRWMRRRILIGIAGQMNLGASWGITRHLFLTLSIHSHQRCLTRLIMYFANHAYRTLYNSRVGHQSTNKITIQVVQIITSTVTISLALARRNTSNKSRTVAYNCHRRRSFNCRNKTDKWSKLSTQSDKSSNNNCYSKRHPYASHKFSKHQWDRSWIWWKISMDRWSSNRKKWCLRRIRYWTSITMPIINRRKLLRK